MATQKKGELEPVTGDLARGQFDFSKKHKKGRWGPCLHEPTLERKKMRKKILEDKQSIETSFNHRAPPLMQGIKWRGQKMTVEIERGSQSRRRSNGRDEAKGQNSAT
ncbi:unnamed protein product [Dovyalis caffra]|uniref:Uncharacterized protein n=1 Tax=Dovyalis caffra TaxID=77055 RepID=A0AAV1RBT3_9ROSI|nr:unnamed protein product [Dovyalis caffra]